MFAKFMKSLLAALLICTLLISLALPALAEHPFQGLISKSTPLRKSASSKADKLLTLPAGDSVFITGESGSYYIVEYDGVSGYVSKADVSSGIANVPTDAQSARYPVLYQGNDGQLVEDLQTALIQLGYLSGKADGKYGEKTAKAVAAFQKNNRLNDSGCADAATQGKLYETEAVDSQGRTRRVTVAPTIEGFPISRNKTGELVRRIQSCLTVLGYYSGEIDGQYGPGTKEAVTAFQKQNGLDADGMVGQETKSILFSVQAKPYSN